MIQSKHVTILDSKVPVSAVALLAIVFGFGLFVVGYDQGHLMSLVIGEQAFKDLYLHEMMHDMRHAAGFPCH